MYSYCSDVCHLPHSRPCSGRFVDAQSPAGPNSPEKTPPGPGACPSTTCASLWPAWTGRMTLRKTWCSVVLVLRIQLHRVLLGPVARTRGAALMYAYADYKCLSRQTPSFMKVSGGGHDGMRAEGGEGGVHESKAYIDDHSHDNTCRSEKTASERHGGRHRTPDSRSKERPSKRTETFEAPFLSICLRKLYIRLRSCCTILSKSIRCAYASPRMRRHSSWTSGVSPDSSCTPSTSSASFTCWRSVDPQSGVIPHLAGSAEHVIPAEPRRQVLEREELSRERKGRTADTACTLLVGESVRLSRRGLGESGVSAA